MKNIYLLLILAAPLSAQLHFGVKGGAPFNDALSTSGTLESRFSNWTLGPMVDLDLPLGLGVEFDALYRTAGYRSATEDTSGTAWSFPLVAKYKFPGVLVRPYVLGGFVYRHVSSVGSVFDGSGDGFTFGGGLRFKAGPLAISPELRYTRWGEPKVTFDSLKPNLNQVEFLVGLTF